jgi:hypothetical protein
LGIWNVPAMLREMPSQLLTEWMAYHNLEPFGDELLDIHLAELKALTFNAARQKGVAALEPDKARLWKKIKQFDPQEYFNSLKASLTFKKWD